MLQDKIAAKSDDIFGFGLEPKPDDDVMAEIMGVVSNFCEQNIAAWKSTRVGSGLVDRMAEQDKENQSIDTLP